MIDSHVFLVYLIIKWELPSRFSVAEDILLSYQYPALFFTSQSHAKGIEKAKIHGSLTLNIKVNFAIVARTESQLPVSVTVRQSRAYPQ